MSPPNQSQPPREKTIEPALSRSVRAALWIGVVTALLAVFAFYGQLELALRWVEMKLC
jgi:hypothetical protein